MADTHNLALITQSMSQSDRRDAATLGELGLRMPQMLHRVDPCSLSTQTDRTVLRARDGAVQAHTKLINTVRGMVKSFGERLPQCKSAGVRAEPAPDTACRWFGTPNAPTGARTFGWIHLVGSIWLRRRRNRGFPSAARLC